MDKNAVDKVLVPSLFHAIARALISLSLLGALTSSAHTIQGMDQMQLQEDIRQLDSFRSSRDLDTLEAVVNSKSEKWKRKDRQSFLTYMYSTCTLLSSYDLGNQSRQTLLLDRYAVSVLTEGDLPLKEYVEFVEFLTQDPLIIDEVAWKKLREQKARLWLEAWRRVANSIDPSFNFGDLPLLNVQAPPVTGLPAGASPESIKDPKLRVEYENAIAQNSAKARRYNEQYWLKQNAPSFFKEAERYLVNAYARPPADLSELERSLSEYIASEDVRKRVIEAARKRQN